MWETTVNAAKVEATLTISTERGNTFEKTTTKRFGEVDLEILGAEADWSDRTLNRINVAVENTGDTRTDVDGTVSRDGENLMETVTKTVRPGETVVWTFGSVGLDRYEGSGTARYEVNMVSDYDSASTVLEKSFE